MDNTQAARPSTAGTIAFLWKNCPDAAQVISLTWDSPPWPLETPGRQGVLRGERLLRAPKEWTRARRRTALAGLSGLVQTRELPGIGLAIRAATPNLEAEFAQEASRALEKATHEPGCSHLPTTSQPPLDHLATSPEPGGCHPAATSSTCARIPISGSPLENQKPDRSGKAAREGKRGGKANRENLEALGQDVAEILGSRYVLDLEAVLQKVQAWVKEGRELEEIRSQAQSLAGDTEIIARDPLRLMGWRMATGFQFHRRGATAAQCRVEIKQTEQYCLDLQAAREAAERDRERVQARLAARRTARAGGLQ